MLMAGRQCNCENKDFCDMPAVIRNCSYGTRMMIKQEHEKEEQIWVTPPKQKEK